MISIFTIPKPFRGHIGVIQENAIRSWTELRKPCGIILVGDDFGVGEFARKLRLGHIKRINKNKFGTPLLDDAFAKAVKIAKYSVICYVNADILLTSDILEAVSRIKFPQYLAIGRRYDLNVTKPINFKDKNWEKKILDRAKAHGKPHPPAGSDYFIFPRNSPLSEIPPFVVGRPGWDNWMIYNARRLKIPVVELSLAAMVIHQNHDYSHIPLEKDKNSWYSPEADINKKLINEKEKIFDLRDSTHMVTRLGVIPPIYPKYWIKKIKTKYEDICN